MKTNDSSGIVFDAKSGISEEEQREILAKIDSIAEKNRLSLMEDKNPRFKAKKTGGVFPIAVNIAAIAALAGGLLFLSSMQWKTDAQARTGSKVYNSVERALIEEIRKETHNDAAVELERLNRDYYLAAAIEDQIGAFFANLNRQINDNNLDEAAGTIKSMRDFINTPAFQSLRSIQARKGLYTQAVNSFETMIEETKKYQAALSSDNSGANPFSDFQARIARLEQELTEKDKSIEALSSQGSGASRRLNDLQKANSSLQTENRQLERTNNTLQTRNTQLTADLQRQNQSSATLQQSVNSLQQSVNTLQQSERDLQTENARLNQTVSARDNTISSNENTIRELQRQNETLTTRLNRLQGELQKLIEPEQ
jgi:myosin heavy subunit